MLGENAVDRLYNKAFAVKQLLFGKLGAKPLTDTAVFNTLLGKYDSFDIRVEIGTTVKYVTIRNGKVADEKQYETDDPRFGDSAEQADQVEQPS